MPPFTNREESRVRLQLHTGTMQFLFASLSLFSFPRFDLGTCSAPPLHLQLLLPALLRNTASVLRAPHPVYKKADLRWNFPLLNLTESSAWRALHSGRAPPLQPKQTEWVRSQADTWGEFQAQCKSEVRVLLFPHTMNTRQNQNQKPVSCLSFPQTISSKILA